MRRRRQGSQVKPRRGASWAFAVVAATGLAFTLYLANRADALSTDEHAFARAQPCATQGPGNRDCLSLEAGTAVEPPLRKRRSPVTTLKVATGGQDITLTFPHDVNPAFQELQADDYVGLTVWRGAIVAATAEGDTEATGAAPAERHRDQLVGVFFAASFTLVLFGMTVYSMTFADWFSTDRRRRVGLSATVSVTFTGFAMLAGAVVLMSRGSLRTALLAVPITDAVALVVATAVLVWRRVARQRETNRLLLTMRAGR